ncbi:heme-binding domain-containing protein [Deinococcus roseus]|nr:heme-binding domain-containing protein [Deinococcus roseus]
MHSPRRSPWPRILLVVFALFLLIQVVPFGRAHTNPPVQATPQWDRPVTAQLFARACQDCHSNQTTWPWYSNVAPVSWLVQSHVQEGRSKFNINEPGFGREAHEAAETVEEGKMPDRSYLPLHPEARLTDSEKQQLISGLKATFGESGEDRKNRDGGED